MWTNENLFKLYENKPDPKSDNQKMTYDKDRYDWAGWVLDTVRELRPNIDNLQDVHLHFTRSELMDLRKHLEKLTNSREFSQKLDEFLLEYMSPIVGSDDFLVQSTCGIRIVVPDQAKLGRLTHFHTGYWTGYTDSMTTCWVPLTKSFDSNTLRVVSWEDSLELKKQIHHGKLSVDEIQEICGPKSYPVNLDVGEAWIFGQSQLHGNFNNETGVTRMSFDVRCALADGDFGVRRPGSFYRLLGTYHALDQTKINKDVPWVTFVDQNSDYVGMTPHFMVREFMLSHVSKYDLNIVEWYNANWYCGEWMPRVSDVIRKESAGGIVMPSIHAFSCDVDFRLSLFSEALEKGIQILFCDENILLNDADDLEMIKRIYQLEKNKDGETSD